MQGTEPTQWSVENYDVGPTSIEMQVLPDAKYTGDVNKAAALLKLGIKSGLSELQELYTKYKVYSLLVYEHGYELL